MDRIIDSLDRHGVRWVGIVQGKGASATVWQVEDAESSQALAVRFMRSKQSWEHFKSNLSLVAVPVDFSDPVLRHTQPGLAGLSKLRNTALCHELVIAEPPRYSVVRSSIVRRGETVWDKQSLLGLDQLMFAKHELEALLFQHEELCEPGTVHYVLLGASLSTDKDAFELQHGDVIRASSQEDGLQLSNFFEDDVVRQSCNC